MSHQRVKSKIGFSSYCLQVLSSIETFKKEIKLTAKSLKIERDQKVLQLLNEIVVEERQIENVSSNYNEIKIENYSLPSLQNLEFLIQEEEFNLGQEIQSFKENCIEIPIEEETPEQSDEISQDELFKIKDTTNVLEELINTEESYIQYLIMYSREFENGLKSILTPKIHNSIFIHLQKVIDCCTILWDKYFNIANNNSEVIDKCKTIAQAFISEEEILKNSYSPYISRYDDITEGILELKKNKNAEQLLDKIRIKLTEDNFKIRNINSFAIAPVQRLPRYKLLLQEVLKKLPSTWKALKFDVENAINSIGRVTDFCNDEARSVTLQSTINELEKKLLLKNLSIRRLYEIWSNVRWIKNKKKNRTGSVYLFEDCFLLVPEASKQRYNILYFKKDISDIHHIVSKGIFIIITENYSFELELNNPNDIQKVIRLTNRILSNSINEELQEIQPKGKIFHWLIKQNSKLTLR